MAFLPMLFPGAPKHRVILQLRSRGDCHTAFMVILMLSPLTSSLCFVRMVVSYLLSVIVLEVFVLVDRIMDDLTSFFLTVKSNNYHSMNNKLSYNFALEYRTMFSMYYLVFCVAFYVSSFTASVYVYTHVSGSSMPIFVAACVLAALYPCAVFTKDNIVKPFVNYRFAQRFGVAPEWVYRRLVLKFFSWTRYRVPLSDYVENKLRQASALISYGSVCSDKDDLILDQLDTVSALIGFQVEMERL